MKDESTGPQGPVLFALAAFLVVFAPLFRGGNRPLPLLALEMTAVAVLLALAWNRGAAAVAGLSAPVKWGLGLLALVPLAQLVPLPASWWRELPGHAPYFRALELLGSEAAQAARALSLHPRATQYAGLALLPPLAIFLATRSLSRTRLRRLAVLFVGVAVAEALLGVLQLGASAESLFVLGNPHGGGLATGTYINRNHFAALMAMALPMAVALWALEVVPPSRDAQGARIHPRHADRRVAIGILLSMVVLLPLVALAFTRSRAGLGSGLLAMGLAAASLVWRAGPLSARAAFGAVALASLAFAAYIGLTPVLERFAPDQLSLGYEGRLRLASSTFAAALDFLPFGSGLGTYADVFPRYQGAGLPVYVDHAHNDYAEFFLEAGVAAVAVVALFAFACVARCFELRRPPVSRSLRQLQWAAGCGMLAMAVHAWFDFNFHIPANALYFAFLGGIFFHDGSDALTRGGGPA